MQRQWKEFPWINPLHFSLELLHFPFHHTSPYVHSRVATSFTAILEVMTKTHFLSTIWHRSDGDTTVAERREPQTPCSSLHMWPYQCSNSNLPGHRLGHLLPREWPIVGAQQIHAPNCGPPSRRKRSCLAQGEAGRSQVRCRRAEWSTASRPHPTSCCPHLQQTKLPQKQAHCLEAILFITCHVDR
jgi:hypothetical protein